jgi:hypothetical protein
LGIIDLEFLLISSISATYKILGIQEEVNDEELNDFVNNYFSENSIIDF